VDSARPAAAFAEIPRTPGLHEVFGFDSPSAGPLVVAVVSAGGKPDPRAGDRGVTVGVFDAVDGKRLAWWRTGIEVSGGVVATHAYQSADGPVVVLAPDRLPVRQWLLPEGRPVGPVIEPGGHSRAVASYRDGGRTILVVADAKGLLRRFDAATGAPVGEPVRYGPSEPSRGPLSRLVRRPEPEPPTFPGSLALGISTGPPSFVVTDRNGALWSGSFASGTATAVPIDLPQRIWFVQPDPIGRAGVFLVTGPGFAGFCDAGTGEFVTPPIRFVSDSAGEEPDGAGALLISGELRVFVAVSGGILGFTAGQECGPHRLYAPDEECGPHRLLEPDRDLAGDDWLESLTMLPVGDRHALFAVGDRRIYRLDAATGRPWPAE
jgi:hypothetical protein